MANQYQTVSAAQRKEIARLHADGKGISTHEIGRQLGLHQTTVLRYVKKSAPDRTPEQIEDAIRTTLRRGHVPADELANDLGITAARLGRIVAAMQRRGALIIELPGGVLDMAATGFLAPGRHELKGDPKAEWTHHFGITSDNHLCNKQSRLDVLKAAYAHFERQGITTVFNAGNWIDGEARFNKQELLTAPGMDSQLDYMIDKWPLHDGITALYVAGDDHEGWYSQREGVEIGKYLQMRAEDQGRRDLKYLGYSECDIALKCGLGSAVMRVLHPGGGSAYATSYTAQKIVESYQGGEKPQVLLIGHYHKFEYGYPREVHCIQTGCTQDQSLFMRKKKIGAHVGFVEVKIKQDSRGVITRCAVEWFPFYDRGFYSQRFK